MYVHVYSGIRYVVQIIFRFNRGPAVTEGSGGSLLLGTILKRASYKTFLYPLRPVPYTSNGTPWTMVPSTHGTDCKHYPLIPPLVSNNNLALLRCVLRR